MAVDRDGSVTAWKPLARDTLGALVNQPYLAAELERMLRLGYEVLPCGVPEFAPAAGRDPITQVMEGDPADVGTSADAKVAAAALPAFPRSHANSQRGYSPNYEPGDERCGPGLKWRGH